MTHRISFFLLCGVLLFFAFSCSQPSQCDDPAHTKAPVQKAKAGKTKTGKIENIEVNLRKRIADESGTFAVKNDVQQWNPQETAIIICDMWNQHWCKGATARVAEMAPAMNKVLKNARSRGVTIIHAPSGCMKFYEEGHPARKRAQEIVADPVIREVIPGESWCQGLTSEKDVPFPVDHKDGGCDCEPKCPGGGPWTRQIDLLEIDEEKDLITDSGVAIGSYFKQNGIKNVIVMGVHTNMCVIGRPFGLRQQFRLGNNVVLMRDMTDTMYNSRSWPNVSHFKGTDFVVEHIEKYVCPSILSTDLTGEDRFAFKGSEQLGTVSGLIIVDEKPKAGAVVILNVDGKTFTLTANEDGTFTTQPLRERAKEEEPTKRRKAERE
jgi:nicotinamidase-related amidase